MTGITQYFAVTDSVGAVEDPLGLVRRRRTQAGGLVDEALQADMTWAPTSAIVSWRRDAMDFELTEISEEEAQRLIETFRRKWGAQA